MPSLAEYLRMPWTVKVERQEDGDGVWFEATVGELAGLYASVPESGDLQPAFYEVLGCHLWAMLLEGTEIPIPAGYRPAPPEGERETWTSSSWLVDHNYASTGN